VLHRCCYVVFHLKFVLLPFFLLAFIFLPAFSTISLSSFAHFDYTGRHIRCVARCCWIEVRAYLPTIAMVAAFTRVTFCILPNKDRWNVWNWFKEVLVWAVDCTKKDVGDHGKY
jgi:hypothetical protein